MPENRASNGGFHSGSPIFPHGRKAALADFPTFTSSLLYSKEMPFTF